MSKSPAPKGLKPAGAGLWRKITDVYELRSDELVTLESACRASDRVALMRNKLGDQVTATGSMGQIVVHPLVAEIRAHEAQVTSLLTRLKLPDEPAGDGAADGQSARSTSARAAAQSRWGTAHGAGA